MLISFSNCIVAKAKREANAERENIALKMNNAIADPANFIGDSNVDAIDYLLELGCSDTQILLQAGTPDEIEVLLAFMKPMPRRYVLSLLSHQAGTG